MRRSISRYLIPIPDNGRFSLKLTPEAEILTVQETVQEAESKLSIWILMNLDAKLERTRDFLLVYAGDLIEENSLSYVGTFQLPWKVHGLHLFEIK